MQGGPGRVRKNSPPAGVDPRTVRLVASRYTGYAIVVEAEERAQLYQHTVSGPSWSVLCLNLSLSPSKAYASPQELQQGLYLLNLVMSNICSSIYVLFDNPVYSKVQV